MKGLAPGPTVTDEELVDAIGKPITRLDRRPWEYSTSAPLEAVTIEWTNGRRNAYILKHLSPGEMADGARRVKPVFVINPRREIETYRRLLAPVAVGPRLVASRCIPESGTYWVLLQRVRGVPLYERGEPEVWAAVARWLARFHERFAAADTGRLARDASLIHYDARWYRNWLDRARRFFAAEAPRGSRCTHASLDWLAARYDGVIDRLLALPTTLIHGEFYPSNVLVTGRSRIGRVYPIDWEVAAVGPGIVDLAALTSGGWKPAERHALAAAYLEGGMSASWSLPELLDTLRYARIHLAVQWLGWFGRRQPPTAHARDWLGDAIDEAEMLRL